MLGIQAAVEAGQPLYIELARILAPGSDALTDPAYEAYHGLAVVPVAAQLADPGQKVATSETVVSMSCAPGQQAIPQPALPRPEASANPKVSFCILT